jgi:hypothetical protein
VLALEAASVHAHARRALVGRCTDDNGMRARTDTRLCTCKWLRRTQAKAQGGYKRVSFSWTDAPAASMLCKPGITDAGRSGDAYEDVP